jgi:hypothetical protein
MAAGSEILLLVIGLLFVGVVYGYYTVKGSGISETPYGKIYSGAPAAGRKASASGKDDRVVLREWSRGTR